MVEELTLAVADAEKIDVGRNVVRLNSSLMEKLELEAGDVVEISGTRTVPAVVWRGRYEDEGLDIIHMDSMLRRNAGVSLGDTAAVKKSDPQEAKVLHLAPAEQQIKIRGDISSYFKEKLQGKPIIRNNVILFELFSNVFPFVVTKTDPGGVVMVSEKTQISVSEKPVRISELAKVPEVSYEDIGGLKEEVQEIREMIELPLKHPELFDRLGVEPPKGVLLHGPPGTGKTLIARAVASECCINTKFIQCPMIINEYGVPDENLRKLFEASSRDEPLLIILDGLDTIGFDKKNGIGSKGNSVEQLSSLLDNIQSNTMVIATTNCIEIIDPALRRPGRFDREIKISVPDKEGRKEILHIHTRGMPLDKQVSLDTLADNTQGFTGSDLELLCKEAAMCTVKRIFPRDIKEERIPQKDLEKIKIISEDFEKALKNKESRV
ncbi:MAG: AAA family ATPase [Candidatus Methanofastidiosia archaeon]